MEFHGATALLPVPATRSGGAAVRTGPVHFREMNFHGASALQPKANFQAVLDSTQKQAGAKTSMLAVPRRSVTTLAAPKANTRYSADAKTAPASATADKRVTRAADLPPEKLAYVKNLSEAEKVSVASRHFEAMMLRQVLANAHKPVIQSSLTSNSATASIYRDMVTSNLADAMAKSGGFGLGKVFEQQLQKQVRSPAAPAAPKS
ncbi:MAG: rod-binding protein [Verrucomicrobia bacterium]|nr:rod-binding protein [Verrucomicrobiota bacterium]